jgi:catechol 2,3-dioxygenase-like lactoylglutathione lyase family enzyme
MAGLWAGIPLRITDEDGGGGGHRAAGPRIVSDVTGSPGYPQYLAGRSAMDAGDLEAAAAHLRRSCDASPHFKALELLGECLLGLDRVAEAVVPLASATTLNRGVRAPSLLAEAFLRLGDTGAAADAVEIALARDPNNRAAGRVREALSREGAAAVSVRPEAAPARSLAQVALVVRDCDEAIAYFTGRLGFTLVEDTWIAEQEKRWVVVAPPEVAPGVAGGATLLLARASNATQEAAIGNQTGGRVGFFLRTDDFWRDHREMRAKGVEFVREPLEAEYGTAAVFRDLYGNLWDLVGPPRARPEERSGER